MIIFHNPKDYFYGRRLYDLITFRKWFKKYLYIINYCINNNIEFIFYDDISKNFIITQIKYFIWAIINKINPIKIIFKVKNKIKDNSDDIFLSYVDWNLNNDYNFEKLKFISNYNFVKIFHSTHYVHKTSIINNRIKELNIDFLIAENNLYKNSDYFKNKMNNYKKDVYTLPFVYDDRFKKNIDFNKRKNICIATWTFYNIEEWLNLHILEDFVNFFNENTLHPIRKEIYNNKNNLNKYIDSYINDFNEEKPKIINNKSNFLKNYFYKINNFLNANKQKKYFNFDIVKKYNDYNMFINPEELVWLPWIWFVEWMACWCAYIGKIDPMYTDIWLIPWIHYIWHNWTLGDIIEKIKYYQKHSNELELIANNWYKYVIENFNWKIVAKKFILNLNKFK